ncbi:MAG: hypothetical protein BGO49_13155 [Planctomycetales bacterium 71-10]|nr:MAG: hypothetical protein BGO49_13155 [Planctomycetales bacterium 71-10]
MMFATAVAAAACRWPLAAMLLGVAFGGPVVGAWLCSREGGDRIVAGAVFGGVSSYAAMATLFFIALKSLTASGWSVGFALATAALALFYACVGMLVGAIVGGVWLSVVGRRRT